jgi:uncharacterized protein (TIGR00369 family)
MRRRSRAPKRLPSRLSSDLFRAARRRGFHYQVGFRVLPERSGRGFCTVSGRVEPRHLNLHGAVHGGVYATILDTAMGGAVVSLLAAGETAATTSLYLEFLRAAREGELLTAVGKVLRRGQHIAFAEGNLVGSDGEQLSRADGTWYIWSASEPSAAGTKRSAGARRRPS